VCDDVDLGALLNELSQRLHEVGAKLNQIRNVPDGGHNEFDPRTVHEVGEVCVHYFRESGATGVGGFAVGHHLRHHPHPLGSGNEIADEVAGGARGCLNRSGIGQLSNPCQPFPVFHPNCYDGDFASISVSHEKKESLEMVNRMESGETSCLRRLNCPK